MSGRHLFTFMNKGLHWFVSVKWLVLGTCRLLHYWCLEENSHAALNPTKLLTQEELFSGSGVGGLSFSACLLLGSALPLSPALYSPPGLSLGKSTLLRQFPRQLHLGQMQQQLQNIVGLWPLCCCLCAWSLLWAPRREQFCLPVSKICTLSCVFLHSGLCVYITSFAFHIPEII